MRNAVEAVVERAIVHITDREQAAPVYSEVDLDLGANEPLREYFSGQVRNALSDDTTAAIFARTGPQEAKEACLRILDDPDSLVEASQALARLLHSAMGTDRRIAPGSLAVCVYTVAEDARSLALIKLDPGRALVQKVVKEKGKRLVSFDVRGDVMPTANERLHKAALVPPAGSERYDLLLLDRQTADAPAMFFAEAFLNTAPVFGGQKGAKGFYDGSRAAYTKLLKEGTITPAQADTLEKHIDVALQTPRVHRPSWVKELPLPEAAKTVINEELKKKFPGTPSIPIDVGYAGEKLTKKKRFRGDYGVVFEVEAAHYDDVVLEKTTYDREDGTPVTRLVLEVPRLQWVK